MTSREDDRCPAVWDVLHDATVIGISGDCPGTLQLELECDYLRDRIDDPGERFFLKLDNCTHFLYRPWADDSQAIDNLNSIAARRLWILGADRSDGFCVVHCSEHIAKGSGGNLAVAAARVTISVDGGREITQNELEDVAEEYWSGFGTQPKNQP